MRRGAGTGAGYGRVQLNPDDLASESKDTSMRYKKDKKCDGNEADSYYD